jgi:hypothetical protein
MENIMNKSETFGYKWLVKKGYTGIVFRHRDSPDFTTNENENFEVKLSRHNTISFTWSQFIKLSDISNTKILVFDDTHEEPLYIIPVLELLNMPKIYNNLKIGYSDEFARRYSQTALALGYGIKTFSNGLPIYQQKNETNLLRVSRGVGRWEDYKIFKEIVDDNGVSKKYIVGFLGHSRDYTKKSLMNILYEISEMVETPIIDNQVKYVKEGLEHVISVCRLGKKGYWILISLDEIKIMKETN